MISIVLTPEHFNLHHVDENIFVAILKSMLKGFVDEKVELSSKSWFNYDWLQRVWNCLKRDFKDNLDLFIGLHLLLVSNNKVVKLTQKPTLIGTSFIDRKINKCFIQICEKLNIEFVETQNKDVYTHPYLWNGSILPPRIKSIVKFLVQGPVEEQLSAFERFCDDEREYFISSLVSEMMSESLTIKEVNLLRSLKIFKTIHGSGKEKAELVSLNDVNVAINDYPHHVPPVPSFVKLVDLSKESSKQLATLLSIKFLSGHCLLDEAFIPGIQHSFYNQKEIQLLMKHVCQHFKIVSQNAQTILSEIHFVTKHDGTSITRPKDLFDHKDNSLVNILEEDDFPGEEWKNLEFHHLLIKLGLKGSHLITKDDCIKIIKSLPNRSMDSKTYSKFLEFLNERTHLLDESFKNQVRQVKWIKFKNIKPRGYPGQLTYKGKEVTVPARIDDVVSSSFEKIVGSTCLLIDCKHLSGLETFFGWNKCPHIGLILQHLKNIIISFEPSIQIQVANFLLEIYENLDKFLETELKASMDTNFPWVWTGETFSSSKNIVRNHPQIDTSPYIIALPTDFQRFNNLWISLNISSDVDYICVLKLIKEQHENTNCINENMVDHDLHLAIRILNHLADKDDFASLTGIIYVPIKTNKHSNLIMEAIENCVYCDESWYQNGFDVEDLDDNIHLIHDKIPMITAEKLNIASCLSKLLNVEEIQSWGQEEPITTHLRNLLKDYTDGLSVLKELIQNADDAGATEISFVSDERTNKSYRQILLDESMKDLQGPAIWCHNNAMFTEEDFKNITKLGGATKECMCTKIGKFGLGFNSVYNLTEVPTFVSGNYVVFFDPHSKYLGKALTNKNCKGIRLKLEGNKRLSRLRDQFAPFNGIFGCDFNKIQKYKGTLFRFPLRTQYQAQSSEICKKHYNTKEVVQLFECLKNAGADLFLFAQNLVKINLYHINKNSEGPHMSAVYGISRKIKEVIHNFPQVNAFSYLEAVFQTLQVPRKSNEFLLIVETNETFAKQRTNKSEIWYISWCTGVGRSYELHCEKPSWLPIGAVAVKVELSEEETWKLQETSEGKMFCFMPLPCKSTLPFHVNGYFALNASRTHIYLKVQNDKTDERCDWNEALLTDSITSAYCNLLHLLANINLNVYNIFPNISNWQDNLLLVESIYKKLIQENFCVFKSIVDEHMYSFNNCRILGSKLQDKCFYQAIERSIKTISTLKGVPLLKIPQNIYNCLLQMDNVINFQSQVIELKEFYEDWFIPNLSVINIKDRGEIIVETVIDSHLNGFVIKHACIPVTPDGKNLKFIQEVINPTSTIAKLFDDEDQMFPFVSKHMNDRKRSYLQILCNFGMRLDSLTEEEIVDRCYSVEKFPDTMKDRLPVLLNLIEDCLSGAGYGEIQPNLSFVNKIENIKMFPSKVKPKGYPLSWKESSTRLISFKDGYLEKKMLIAAPNNALIDEAQSFRGRYSSIKNHFGLKEKVLSIESLQVLVEELGKQFNENDNFSIKDIKLKNVLRSIVDEMHEEVDLMIQHKIHIPKLSELRFILTNGHPSRLLTSKQCRKFIHKSLLPYMCGVHETSLSKWDLICQTIKIKDNFTVDEFVHLLNEIEKKFHSLSLNKPMLSLVLDVLECISNAISTGKDKVPQQFFLPSKEGILCLSSRLKYNDCDWSQLQSSEYCHDKISISLAKELGIKTVRENSLSNSRLSYSFGQSERLVNRINRIILGYPKDESIFKEMVQNADDALASEIHFINDTRNLPDEKVFCDEWKLMQGPALCVYNNKSFTLSDLNGIQKLGEGSKQNDITKTGQYGVGFNCVYHLTDAPSFLTTIKADDRYNDNSEISGSVLAIFDPNCHFLPGVNPFNPGALYKSEIISEMFPDVYNGYLQNIEKYNVNKKGTMFRLPLRNFQSKELSEIHGDIVSTKELEKLYIEFRKESHLILLFLKSLESIYMLNVAYDSSQNTVTKEIHKVCLQFDKDAKAKKEKFMKSTKYLSEKLQRKDIKLKQIKSQEILYEVKVHDSNSKDSNWILVQRFGFNNADDNESNDDESDDSEAYTKGEINFQPFGGIAYQTDNFHSYKVQKGKIFTFLPLNRTTKLPMHINGHFFLNHEDRRDLWNDKSNETWIKWNEAVLSQIIAPAYCSLLKHLKQREVTLKKSSHFQDILYHFYELFPTEYTKPLDILTREIYKFIYRHELDLFLLYNPCTDIIEWTHVHDETYFDDLDSQLSLKKMKDSVEIRPINEKVNLLRETLHSCGLITIVGPIHLWSNFIKAGIKDIKKIAPSNVKDHLSSSSLFKDLPQKLEDTPFKSVEGVLAVLEYISNESKNSKDSIVENSKLANLPLLLTSSNILNKVDINCMLFESKHSSVAPHKLDQFIHPAVESFFLKGDVLKRLNISDFGNLLKDSLFESLFFNRNCPKLLKFDDFCLQFSQSLQSSQCCVWLKAVWKFIGDVLKDPHEFISIESLHIIPVKLSDTAYLYPLRKRLCVLRPPEPNDKSSRTLFESLESVGVPLLNMQLFNSFNSRYILDLFGHVHSPANLLTALEEVYLNLKVNNILSKDQGLEILKYLENNSSIISCCPNARRILASLPFYVDINNKQTSLNIGKTFTISPDIPAFSTAILQGSPLIFKRNGHFKNLFQLLEIKNLRDDETYILFLFDAFQYFSRESQLEHLERIKIISESGKLNFIEILKDFAFIEYRGCLRKASYFYDDVEIFNLMEEIVFPFSDQFVSPSWKMFLKKCGLVTELSKGKFLEYAHKLSKLRFDTSKVQTLMMECLLKESNGGWITDKFLKRLKSISFLYPSSIDKELSIICCREHHLNYIPFQNSVLQKHVRLSWTVSNILPDIVNNFEANLLQRLEVKTETDSSLVANNLRNISSGFEKLISSGKQLDGSIVTLIKELTYEHLSWFVSKSLNQGTLKSLQNIKCLYIDEMRAMVRPNQVVTDILSSDQIFPYIVKFPIFYGKQENLLRQLGATKLITVEQCARSLNEIKNTIGEQKMDPNLKNIAYLLFKKLLKLAYDNISEFESLEKLFLPCEGDTLCDSTKIYCTSKCKMREFILNNLGHPVIIIDEFELLLKMPQSIRPKFLNDCLQETIFDLGEDITLEIVQNLQRNIMHQFFLDGLNRLKNHFSDNVSKSDEPSASNLEKLSKIKFLSKKSIHVHHLLNGKAIENSLKEVYHFISQDLHHNTIEIYVSPKVKKNKFLLNLSRILAPFLDIPSARMEIKEMLNVEPEEIDDTLNDLEIRFFKHKVPLGIEIPIEDHYTLVQDVHIYHPKQLVAYEVDDPFDRDEDGEPKYILVEIIKEQSSSGSSIFAFEYEVNFGSSTKVILATRLYAFEVKWRNKTVILPPINTFAVENTPEKSLTSVTEFVGHLKSLLKEIWLLREDERNVAIKRLYLRYHPDKNRHDPKLYNEVFKHLIILIKKLRKGITIDDYSVENLHKNSYFETTSNCNRESGWKYFERMDRRANQHSYSKNKKDKKPSESNKSRASLHNNFIRNLSRKRRCKYLNENLPKKCKCDPKNAELWMKQARHDAEVAVNDFNSKLRSSQWRCLKYYQVSVKGECSI